MSYDQIGFDQFLNRELPDIRTQYLEADASYLLPQLSGSTIGGGITTSADGKIIINWDTGEVIFSDGGRGRVYLGKIQGSDEYGIKIVDADGNEVMSTLTRIQTAGLEDGAVTTIKIANLAATSAKIAALAVTTAKIADLAVTSAKILSLNADKINVDQLDALAIRTGTLTVDESITAGGTADGRIYARTAAGDLKYQLDQNTLTVYDDAGDRQLVIDFAQELTEIKSLNVGQPETDVSGRIRVYDSNIEYFDLNVDEGLVMGSGKPIVLTGNDVPAAGAANTCKLYVDAGGAGGKNRLMAIFDTGVAQVVALEP